MEETPTVIYNASETISQEIAPIYRYCASSIYIGYDMFATKQEQFSTFNYWVLSALQNFLSKVFSLNKYYQYYLEVVAINDVDVQFFYLGKMTDLMLNFDMVEFEEVEKKTRIWMTGSMSLISLMMISLL